MTFFVSVIIPVFNREKYLIDSINSVISLEVVKEIILIDDGSSDSSLDICIKYAEQYDRVKLYTHPDHGNKGPSASRNLGIKMASCPYIAFLDSDDWYLENRFEKDKIIFERFSDIDATFSCSIKFENIHDNNLRYGIKFDPIELWGNNLTSFQFYQKVILNNYTLFDTNSVTFKRTFLLNQKLFDERLYLHQDTELWLRLMRVGKFSVAEFKIPVSVVRTHSGNRITCRSPNSFLKMWRVYINNVGVEDLCNLEINIFFKRIIMLKSQFHNSLLLRKISYLRLFCFYFFRKRLFIEREIKNV